MGNNEIISAAVYLFAKDENGEWCVLCGRRSGNDPRYCGGLMDVPCGLREFGETPVENALRELAEETGLRLSASDINVVEKQPWGNGNCGSNFFGVLEGCREPIGGDWEHEYVKWIKVSEIENLKWAYGMGEKALEYFNEYVKETMTINEETLRKIIRVALSEAIDERGTNMDSLYHFTSVDRVFDIINSGELRTSGMQPDKRNQKRYISFTRHKSRLEGFATPRRCNVRIEVDGRGLSNIRHSDTYPFEYYSPNRPWQKTWKIQGGPSAKKMYQDEKRAGHGGESDYMHQAEESFETYDTEIDIRKITREIDIYLPKEFINTLVSCEHRTGYHEIYDEMYDCLMHHSPLLNRTFVYTNMTDFNLQTNNRTPLADFYQKAREARFGGDRIMRRAMEESKK